jgi:hypothetical protein
MSLESDSNTRLAHQNRSAFSVVKSFRGAKTRMGGPIHDVLSHSVQPFSSGYSVVAPYRVYK